MINFKKTYNLKILSVFIAGVFLFTNTTYAIDLPRKSHLRAPLNTQKIKERLDMAGEKIDTPNKSELALLVEGAYKRLVVALDKFEEDNYGRKSIRLLADNAEKGDELASCAPYNNQINGMLS